MCIDIPPTHTLQYAVVPLFFFKKKKNGLNGLFIVFDIYFFIK